MHVASEAILACKLNAGVADGAELRVAAVEQGVCAAHSVEAEAPGACGIEVDSAAAAASDVGPASAARRHAVCGTPRAVAVTAVMDAAMSSAMGVATVSVLVVVAARAAAVPEAPVVVVAVGTLAAIDVEKAVARVDTRAAVVAHDYVH